MGEKMTAMRKTTSPDEIPFHFEDDIIDTPDSGYFELESKPRKKSFIKK